ncbi:MAG: hypothetical protein M1118_06775 [Chloroflexi bacterium]|nr:hypothetical protein [Chloroflexota bacterium]
MVLASVLLLALSLLTLIVVNIHDRHEIEKNAAAAPRPVYLCRECHRPVDIRSTLRPIRETLLCPEHYHARVGSLLPPPEPKPRQCRRAWRPQHTIALTLPPRRSG